MRVLDLGCGVGDVSLLAATMVGAAGSVLGIDRSKNSVEMARRRAEAKKILNVRFVTAELERYETVERFDAVIGRLVLLYQRNPADILRRFAAFLQSKG